MSVEAMLFDRSKYIKVTKNDWILVGIGGKTPIEVQNNNDCRTRNNRKTYSMLGVGYK